MFELRNFVSPQLQSFKQVEDPEMFMESNVKTYMEESNWLSLQGMQAALEHTSQSRKYSFFFRKICTALKLLDFVRREERGGRVTGRCTVHRPSHQHFIFQLLLYLYYENFNLFHENKSIYIGTTCKVFSPLTRQTKEFFSKYLFCRVIE